MPDSRKKVILPGGAGYLGRLAAAHFTANGWEVVVLSRRAAAPDGRCRTVAWDGETLGPWKGELEEADAVVNLAGRSVNCRYHDANRREILESRIRSTRVLGQAIAACAKPPPVWLNSSSATIYRHAEDRPMDEATGELGKGFSVDVVRQWEAELFAAETPRTRRVAMRTALVLGPGDGGVLEAFLKIVRLGLGGTQGSGRQYVSWLAAPDYLAILDWLLAREELEGPVNCASPNPLPNRQFMKALREACRQPIGLPATAWMLEIGAFFLGTETELLLKSRRVVPGRLLESGYQFRYPELGPALTHLLR